MRVLVAYDDSEGADAALRRAARLAAAAGGSLVVLHVLAERDTGASGPVSAAAVEAERTRVAERLAPFEGLPAEVLVEPLAAGEHVGDHIVRVALAREVDAIAIASRRAAGLGGMLLGSVAQQVLKFAEVPVLVVRDKH